MTDQVPQSANTQQEPKNDKELNFRALEQRYQKQLEQERQARLEAERIAQEALQRKNLQEDEDDDSEPYVDKKKLDRKLSSFEKKLEEKIDRKAEEKASKYVEKQRQESWIENNPDFYDVLNQHAEKLAQKSPKLAESILRMPDTFERQQLVYNNIKAMGLDKPEPKQPSVQEKIDANRRSPYYQPSGVATAPYTSAGDFSESGQKNAYNKMQELKKRLRI